MRWLKEIIFCIRQIPELREEIGIVIGKLDEIRAMLETRKKKEGFKPLKPLAALKSPEDRYMEGE